jgi:hypothetical protein
VVGGPAVIGLASAGSFVLPAGTVGVLLSDVVGSTRRWEADGGAMAIRAGFWDRGCRLIAVCAHRRRLQYRCWIVGG